MSGEGVSTWLVVLAGVLDFLFAFVVGGLAIASLTGDQTKKGFRLKGFPALALFAFVVFYFWGLGRAGGTLFERLFGIV